MTTFIIGMIILIVGGYLYGKVVEKVFGPDDRKTPAVELADGVDYVGMKKWKNNLIELLNIAGTGPVLGPIQGILFGPIAFITIPIGCVIAGATHDYFNGMISMRNKGSQMPGLVKKYLGNGMNKFYSLVSWILLLLVGVVFIYTPADLIVGDILGMDASATKITVWVVYAIIFAYYIAATVFPIDKIIGRIYPIFGAILIISAVGVLIGVFMDGGVNLTNFAFEGALSGHPKGQRFIPVFFITVACGIMSGFHGSQSTLISRTVTSEREGRWTFYMMMIVEGFIAMCWAAGAMVLFNSGTDMGTGATKMVGLISRNFLGTFGGVLAVLGVIVLPITSGDTAFRSLRLMFAEQFNIEQKTPAKRIGLTLLLFIPAALILIFAKTNSGGFNLLWRYFGFTNQFVAVFALSMATVYLIIKKRNYLLTLIPGMFYSFIVMSYIFHQEIGIGIEPRWGHVFGLEPSSYLISFILAAICTVIYTVYTVKTGQKQRKVFADKGILD